MAGGNGDNLRIFCGSRSRYLADRVVAHIGIPLGMAKTVVFPDGELIVKLDEDVRGRDCFVVLSTCDTVNDNLMELLVFIDCLKRASAARVTVVAADAETRGWAASKVANGESLDLKAGGMQILPAPAALKADMKKGGDTMLKEWLDKAGPEGQALVDAFRK